VLPAWPTGVTHWRGGCVLGRALLWGLCEASAQISWLTACSLLDASAPACHLPTESFAVDIGGPFRALLPVLAFEGATKRNRPHLQVGGWVARCWVVGWWLGAGWLDAAAACCHSVAVAVALLLLLLLGVPVWPQTANHLWPVPQLGDLVYCRVESAHRDLEPVLSCMDAAGKVRRSGNACGCPSSCCGCCGYRLWLRRPPLLLLPPLPLPLPPPLLLAQAVCTDGLRPQ
jgi:hypothetical protein